MSVVRLTLRVAPSVALEAPCVRPDAFASLSEHEIARLRVWHGKERAALGDFFRVAGGHGDDVRVAGDTSRVKYLGAEMEAGRIVIEGSAGMHTASRMSGGHVRVEGRADDWFGAEMRGGVAEVRGLAGHNLGGAYAGSRRGMAGGLILAHASVGDRAAERMRRGTIAVAGSAGALAACGMVAGTLLVVGDLATGAGLGMNRGTIVAGRGLHLLPTFRYACTYRPSFLPVCLRGLKGHGFSVPKRLEAGPYRRFTGDVGGLGKGEILQWTRR